MDLITATKQILKKDPATAWGLSALGVLPLIGLYFDSGTHGRVPPVKSGSEINRAGLRPAHEAARQVLRSLAHEPLLGELVTHFRSEQSALAQVVESLRSGSSPHLDACERTDAFLEKNSLSFQSVIDSGSQVVPAISQFPQVGSPPISADMAFLIQVLDDLRGVSIHSRAVWGSRIDRIVRNLLELQRSFSVPQMTE